MSISEIIKKLAANPGQYGIQLNAPASVESVEFFERRLECRLPDDLRAFYLFSDGFYSDEDMFSMISLDEIQDPGKSSIEKSFIFSEYMIYCDLWQITIDPSNHNDYLIWRESDKILILGKSLSEFLGRFLAGGVFGKGGLYDWHEEIGRITT